MAAFVASSGRPLRVATQAATVCGCRPGCCGCRPARPARPAATGVRMAARGRGRGKGNNSGGDETVDYASQSLSVLADDMCDVSGQNCGPDGSPPAAASKVVPPREGRKATEGRMPPLADYSGKESVLQVDAHETSG